MWTNPKIKNAFVGNYEHKNGTRHLRLEYRSSKGVTMGKVFTFSSPEAAKKAGWIYKAE